MATPLEKSVFWRNKETVLQYDGQNSEPVMFENLVIHFDKEKFEEVLHVGSTGRSWWPKLQSRSQP